MSGTKTSRLKLTICICSVPTRIKELGQLLSCLRPQLTDEVEVLVFWNNFEHSLGYLRQEMVNDARGQYVCHIDDDDLVPADYIATLLPLLDGKVDYIGFRVEFFDNGRQMNPVYHSLKYRHWYEDDEGYYRGVTHLNPLKTAIAKQGFFTRQNVGGEDHDWAISVQHKVKTEHFIDRPMYYYHHVGKQSVAYTQPGSEFSPPPDFNHAQIRLHPGSTTC